MTESEKSEAMEAKPQQVVYEVHLRGEITPQPDIRYVNATHFVPRIEGFVEFFDGDERLATFRVADIIKIAWAAEE